MSAGVYLHIPFCKSRCSYCDFATDIYRNSEAVERYVRALCSEIRNSKFEIRNFIDTIYFGGGTPSLLSPKQVEGVLKAVHSNFYVDSNAEITMEMNPATVTPESLSEFKKIGVNRASFGVQTFNDRSLKLLARGHDANDARQTYKMLRDAGFENISFDLIAGLPGQTIDDWLCNLNEAIAMSPEHLSLYILEIHEGTPLAEQVRSGRQPQPDEDLAADMYTLMCDRLTAAGYQQYEISNFARSGFPSRHNSKYWQLDPVYGFGVSAHSFDGRQRYANDRDTARYVDMVDDTGSATVSSEPTNLAAEYVFLALRMNQGICYREYEARFGIDLISRRANEISQLADAGLLDASETHIRLTQKGMLLSNEVFAALT
jgi:oxygen-independent coproporphyrinogen-3 oxidase